MPLISPHQFALMSWFLQGSFTQLVLSENSSQSHNFTNLGFFVTSLLLFFINTPWYHPWHVCTYYFFLKGIITVLTEFYLHVLHRIHCNTSHSNITMNSGIVRIIPMVNEKKRKHQQHCFHHSTSTLLMLIFCSPFNFNISTLFSE